MAHSNKQTNSLISSYRLLLESRFSFAPITDCHQPGAYVRQGAGGSSQPSHQQEEKRKKTTTMKLLATSSRSNTMTTTMTRTTAAVFVLLGAASLSVDAFTVAVVGRPQCRTESKHIRRAPLYDLSGSNNNDASSSSSTASNEAHATSSSGNNSMMKDEELSLLRESAVEVSELFVDDDQVTVFDALKNAVDARRFSWRPLGGLSFDTDTTTDAANVNPPALLGDTEVSDGGGLGRDVDSSDHTTKKHMDSLIDLMAHHQKKSDEQWKTTRITFTYCVPDHERNDAGSEEGEDEILVETQFTRQLFKAKGGTKAATDAFWAKAKTLDDIRAISLSFNSKGVLFFGSDLEDFENDVDKRMDAFRQVRDLYQSKKATKTEVIDMLHKTLNAVKLDTETKLGVTSPVSKYIPTLVQYTPSMSDIEAAQAGNELKSKVIAIAGESGSGKTRFALEGLSPDKPRFYIKLEGDDLKDKVELSNGQSAWRRFVVKAIEYSEQNKLSARIVQTLNSMKHALNSPQNEWALNAFERALLRTDKKVFDWFVGNQDCVQIPEILCIVDEAGKDMDFVRGMVDSAESFFAKDVKRKLGKISLVLCGTRLDSINCTSSGSFIGSDPSKSLVVLMQTTSLDALAEQIDASLLNAVRSGIYSRILGTNVRILTKILLPFLSSQFVVFHSSELTRESHQKLVGSNWLSMAFVPTAYFNLNSLAGLTLEKRDELLVHAFKFFSMKSLEQLRVRSNSLALDPLTFASTNDEIFSRGLATLDAKDTPAIKFLACDGFVHHVLRADGDSLEQALVMHLCRLLAVRGLDPVFHCLQGAWPPQSSKDEMSLWEEGLNAFHIADIDHIAALMRKGEVGIVLRQGVSNAQGPDVLNLHLENDVWVLDQYQSKNQADPGTPRAWAETLGVRVGGDDSVSLAVNPVPFAESPDTVGTVDEAHRAFKAIERFRSELEEKSGKNVSLNRRVLVWSGKWPIGKEKGRRLRDVYDNSHVELWTREFLSPSIECCAELPGGISS